jgi:hypothetical protein
MSNLFEYTDENHYQFGWHGEIFNQIDPFNEDLTFTWKIGKIRKKVDWREACLMAAQHMWTNCPDPYVMVCFSGGIDSEVAIRSFLECNIPVKAAICKFKNNLNSYDVNHAVEFCRKNEVEYYFFELDVLEFLFSENFNSYVKEYSMISPQIPVQLWLLDQFDEFPVVCGGDLALFAKDNKEIVMRIKPQTSTVSRHLLKKNRLGGPLFHIHNPEQVWSFLKDETIKNWCKHWNHKKNKITQNHCLKAIVYEKYFPGLKPRTKKTGFENFQDLDSKVLRPKMEKQNNKYNESILIDIPRFFDLLEGKDEGCLKSNSWHL